MDLNEFYTKYGNQATEELLDIALIKELHYRSLDWHSFCIRYGIIKKSTKIMKIRQSYRSESGEYHITLANGRGEWVLNLVFHIGQIREWKSQH